jgi:hypothetical protein
MTPGPSRPLRKGSLIEAVGQLLAAPYLLDEIYYPLNIVSPSVTAQRIPNEIATA